MSDKPKAALAAALIAEIAVTGPFVVPVQVCLELHHMLVRKRSLKRSEAAAVVDELVAGAMLIASDQTVLAAAFKLAVRHQLQTYDAVILAAAARAGCDILYSEDMQHGFEWSGVQVINPFA